MKNAILFLLLSISVSATAQSDERACETFSKINALIQEQHYRAKPVDDSLSVYVFNAFLEDLDEDTNLFLESEINFLKKHQYKIDDYITEKNCAFLSDFYTTYNQAIARYGAIIESISNEPFPLKSNEIIRFSKKAFPYLKTESELKHLYKKNILFTILRDVAQLSQNKDSLVKVFDKTAELSKIKIFDSYKCKSSKYQFTKKDFNSKFFSVFCSYFDPHTDYFSQNDKSSFLSSVSADNLTFGMYISLNENSEIIVNEILPGSSAYFSEKIESGDQILKIKSDQEEYDIACTNLEKIEKVFSSDDYKIADFTFRKKTGENYTVKLVKKVMKDYQNNVYSYILEKDNNRTGYIKIPSFYSTFENGKTNVSDDVVKEIFKLKEDKVDGLIIDLENNGGGSMDEAIKLCGLFIDAGPIALMNNKFGERKTLKDTNRGTIYSGPLVLLINGFSASASEFFANAMQDYNRAIIVGNTSLGKATMQQILPLKNSNDEFVKLTIEKFYRITGKSNQAIGISPDIEISSLFNTQMPREDSHLTALKNDTIPSNLRYDALPITEKRNIAIESSKKRIAANKDIAAIDNLNKKIDALYESSFPPIQLQFSVVFKELNSVNSLWKEIKKITEVQYPIDVKNNSLDIEYQQYDDYLKSSNTDKIKGIKNNIHILETFNIITDLK